MGLRSATCIWCLFSVACGEAPRAKVVGWPPAEPLPAARAEPPPQVAPSDVWAAPEVGGGGRPDAAESATPSCQRVLGRACQHLGRHSEECAAARSRLPAGPLVPADEAVCERVWGELAPVVPGLASPCWELAKRQCAALGKTTRTCLDARALAARLKRPSDREPCRGDLLLWEIRGVLRALPGGP